MEYREYGKTGKKLSVLGFGGMRFPGELVSTEEGRALCAEIVIKAHDLGINFFDTAHSYCGGHSEEIYGMAFRRMKDSFFVSSKSQLLYDPDESAVRRRIEQSLQTMNLSKIHFFHMWSILNLEQYREVMRPGGPYDGARRAKDEGLIDHICFSTHCTGNEIETIIQDGAFEGVILGYNLLNYRYRQQGLDAAGKHGLGVAIMNPLAGGVLPKNAALFLDFCRGDECIVDAAFRFVLQQRAVTTALSGISSVKELIQNVSSVEKIISHVHETQIVPLEPVMQLNDLCTGCGYCAGCPAGLQISKLMMAYNQAILEKNDPSTLATALHEWWHIGKTEKFHCVECHQCESRCTQHLPIIQRIREINDTIDRQMSRARQNLLHLIGANYAVGLYGIGGVAKQFI